MRGFQRVCGGALLILGACQAEEPPPASALPPPEALPVTETSQDSLSLTMELPARVAVGDAVTMVLVVANASGRDLELYLRGREVTADVTVRDESGQVVWHKLAGAAVPAILMLKPLSAGESFSLSETWDARLVGPGQFVVEAEVLGESSRNLRFPAGKLEIVR